jgi:hypothetical protein
MQDEPDDALNVDVLANALKMGKAEAGSLLETLAVRCLSIMPDTTTVERGGWFFESNRPVSKLTIRFDDCHLQLVREKTGTVTASMLKVVRGVVLKTSTISLEDWIKTLAAELHKAGQHSSATLDALLNFVVGKE